MPHAQQQRYSAKYSNNSGVPRGVYAYPQAAHDGGNLSSDDDQLQWAQQVVSQHARQKNKKKASKVLREMRLHRKAATSSVQDHDLLHDIKQILADSKVDSVDVDYIMANDRPRCVACFCLFVGFFSLFLWQGFLFGVPADTFEVGESRCVALHCTDVPAAIALCMPTC